MNERITGRKIQNENDLVQWVDEQRDRHLNSQSTVFQQWLNVVAAFHNRPDLVTTEDLRLINRISKPTVGQEKKMSDIAVNFVQPQIRTLAAKLQRGSPITECVPFSSDQSDIQAAKVGDKFLQSETVDQRIVQRRLEMGMWLGAAGNAFWHTYFDATRGEMLENGMPVGKIKTDTVSPLKICPEPGRMDIADCWWAIITERLPIYQLQDTYEESYRKRTGTELHLTGGGKMDEYSGAFQNSYLSIIGVMSDSEEYDDYCDVHTVYHRPTKQYKGGFYAIIANSKVLHISDYPYEFLGRLPIFHFREILCPWRFYGDTGTYQTYLNQATYHDLRRLEKRFIKGNTNTKILIREGMKINRQRLGSSDSEILEVSGGRNEKIDVIPPRGVPSSMYPSINLAREEMFHSSGIRESSMGASQQNVQMSGRALLTLQEQDDVRLAFTVQLIEQEMGAWGKTVLGYAKQFYNEPRKYMASGRNLSGGLWYFDRADLKNTTDVLCVSGSAMPLNKYAKREFVIMMYDKGLLGQPGSDEARIRANKMLEFGSYEDIADETTQDVFVADQENIYMEKGQYMEVSEIDSHLCHVKDHRQFAMSPGIRDNPQLLQIFVNHIRAHMMMLNPQQPGQENAQPQTPVQAMQEQLQQQTQQQPQQSNELPVQDMMQQEPSILQE